jgi:DNA-binding NtrC family response regulator
MPKVSILILEDEFRARERNIRLAREAGFTDIHGVKNISEGYVALENNRGFDAMIIDLIIDEDTKAGAEFLRQVDSVRLDYAIIYSGHVTKEKQAELKDEIKKDNLIILRKPIDERILKDKLKEIADEVKARSPLRTIRASAPDKDLEEKIRWFARTDLPVLITGPTGAGKESVGREVAAWSNRDSRLIRTINCGAFIDALLMSELFGHVKGAYTGADRNRLGLILEVSGYKDDGTAGEYKIVKSTKRHEPKSYVDWLSVGDCKPQLTHAPNGEECYALPEGVVGGTLILDEVAELSEQAQAAMLRVLDGLPIKPVGYDGPGFLPNLRIIAVTNDRKKLTGGTGSFRHDLLSRLEGWHVFVEGLAKRTRTAEEIINDTITNMIFRSVRGMAVSHTFNIQDDALKTVLKTLANLKGGVRQLKWLMQRACTFAYMEKETMISVEHVKQAQESGFLWKSIEDELGQAGESGTLTNDSNKERQVQALRLEIETFFQNLEMPLPDEWGAPAFKQKLKELKKDSERLLALQEIVMKNREPEIYARAFARKPNSVGKWFREALSPTRPSDQQ